VRNLGLCTAALLLASCAGPAKPDVATLFTAPGAPSRYELTEVPFFPQSAHQCGPAALATVLVHSGVDADPAKLTDEVYLPGRKGSLPVELAAAARRHGRIPYRLSGESGHLLAEVLAGNPVLVFLDLGMARRPVRHFAVVIGYDRKESLILLRSGKEMRKAVPAGRFLASWRREGSWALVVLPPGKVPATAGPSAFLREAAALEDLGEAAAAFQAYKAALGRWPGNETALLGVANALYATGNTGDAVDSYRILLKEYPGNAAAMNNLAHLLAREGCFEEALAQIRRGRSLVDGVLGDQLSVTEEQIIRMRGERGDAARCLFPGSTVPLQ